MKVISEQPPIPLRERVPELSATVCEIVDRALVKNPEQRWQSAKAMRNALMHAA